jgi:glutamyl-tRNA reductase
VIEFSVIQQPPNAPAFAIGAPVWRTCMRQVAFVEEAGAIPSGVAAWHNDAAYAHLLEVVCGLHSPIVGETEVLHQFKVFADGLSTTQSQWRELCARLLADARAIRSTHLIGLGSRSYGSAVRRHVRDCSRVVLIGTGMLAQEIVPFLVRSHRVIDLWGRRPTCTLTAAGLTYRQLTSPPLVFEEPAAIIVAAPVAAAAITQLVSRYREPSLLIDLRAEGAADPPVRITPIVTLADVFAEFDAVAHDNAERVVAAKAAIAQCALAFASRAKLNPFGWHDLCA